MGITPNSAGSRLALLADLQGEGGVVCRAGIPAPDFRSRQRSKPASREKRLAAVRSLLPVYRVLDISPIFPLYFDGKSWVLS